MRSLTQHRDRHQRPPARLLQALRGEGPSARHAGPAPGAAGRPPRPARPTCRRRPIRIVRSRSRTWRWCRTPPGPGIRSSSNSKHRPAVRAGQLDGVGDDHGRAPRRGRGSNSPPARSRPGPPAVRPSGRARAGGPPGPHQPGLADGDGRLGGERGEDLGLTVAEGIHLRSATPSRTPTGSSSSCIGAPRTVRRPASRCRLEPPVVRDRRRRR